MTIIKPNSTVLFQGDSITDCGETAAIHTASGTATHC